MFLFDLNFTIMIITVLLMPTFFLSLLALLSDKPQSFMKQTKCSLFKQLKTSKNYLFLI